MSNVFSRACALFVVLGGLVSLRIAVEAERDTVDRGRSALD